MWGSGEACRAPWTRGRAAASTVCGPAWRTARACRTTTAAARERGTAAGSAEGAVSGTFWVRGERTAAACRRCCHARPVTSDPAAAVLPTAVPATAFRPRPAPHGIPSTTSTRAPSGLSAPWLPRLSRRASPANDLTAQPALGPAAQPLDDRAAAGKSDRRRYVGPPPDGGGPADVARRGPCRRGSPGPSVTAPPRNPLRGPQAPSGSERLSAGFGAGPAVIR